MKLPRSLPLAFALATLFGGSVQAQNLVQMYDAARGYDANYQSALAQYNASIAKADQATAGILPSVGIGAGYSGTQFENKTGNATFNNNFQTENASISASQPLYRPANLATYEQGRKQVELAKAQLAAVEQDLILRVSQAYFDVLAAQDTLFLVREQKKAVAEQFAAAKRNFEVGTATITDSREAQAAYDLANAQESAADFTLQTKNSALAQLVGKDAIAPWVLVNPFVPPALENDSVQYWQDQSANSDAVQVSRVQYEMAKLDTSAARAGHLPTLTGSLSLTEGRKNPNAAPPLVGDTRSHTSSAALNLNIPIFAGFAIQNQVREKVALEEKARDDLAATERNTAQGSREAFFGVQSLKAQVHALEAAEKSSQSALEANKLGYEVGVRINIDVLNAQTQLYNTQSQLAQARYNLLTTQLKLKQAVGSLAVPDLEKINTYLRAPATAAAIAAAQAERPTEAQQAADKTPAAALKPAADLKKKAAPAPKRKASKKAADQAKVAPADPVANPSPAPSPVTKPEEKPASKPAAASKTSV